MDLNDNRPEFLTSENPVEISVSSHLETGELIAKMEVSSFCEISIAIIDA